MGSICRKEDLSKKPPTVFRSFYLDASIKKVKKREKNPYIKIKENSQNYPPFLETSRLQERGKVFLDQLYILPSDFSASLTMNTITVSLCNFLLLRSLLTHFELGRIKALILWKSICDFNERFR